jgi:hypothetical protein
VTKVLYCVGVLLKQSSGLIFTVRVGDVLASTRPPKLPIAKGEWATLPADIELPTRFQSSFLLQNYSQSYAKRQDNKEGIASGGGKK